MSKRDKLGREPIKVSKTDKARLEAIAQNLGRGKSLRTKITWPGATAELEIRVLAFNEGSACDAAALREVQELIGDSSIPRSEAHDALEGAKAKHRLASACMVVGTDERFFDSPQELGDVATYEEICRVFERYLEHTDEVDPNLEEMPSEHLEVIAEAIKKKDSITLKNIASSMPRSLLLTLVEQLANSLPGSS